MNYEYSILLERTQTRWLWHVLWTGAAPRDGSVASGSSPDYHQACECARVAWEQHAKDET